MSIGVNGRYSQVPGPLKAQLLSDSLHAGVVLFVVACVTVVSQTGHNIPADVLGTVYGGAIGYAAGRAGPVVRELRSTSAQAPPEA